jgi:hypothetical protein
MFNVIDNFISNKLQDQLENILVGNKQFPYFYCLDTVDSYEEQSLFNTNNVLHQPQFVHTLIIDGTQKSNAFDPIISFFNFSQFHDRGYKLSRAKINLLTPPINATKSQHHVPHFDSKNSDDITVIYYVSNSDGDTVIFNERYDNNNYITPTINSTVSPQKGRVLIFPSNLLHASSPPLNIDFRCVINFVFTLNNL